MDNRPIIEIAGLRVSFKELRAVDGLDLSVMRGEVFGLLGPNGAGKTTTLACLEGLRQLDTGTIHVAGMDIRTRASEIKQILGVQLQSSAMFTELKVGELVQLYAALYRCYVGKQQIRELLGRFGLAEKVSARAAQLSGGQQQRLALALAIVNDPKVVVLDEPTTGLDPQARHVVWAVIRRMRGEGRTVLLTTHSMEEAQELCDRVGIIDAGKLVAIGAPRELIVRHAPPLAPEEAARRRPNLEDVFLALTGRDLGGANGSDMQDEEAAWLASMA